MSNNTDIELFHYFKQYTIDRIIGNCKLTHHDTRSHHNDEHKTPISPHTHNTHHHDHEHNTTMVESPSKSDPDYWYEWVRDSAIVIGMAIDQIVRGDIDGVRRLEIMSTIRNYVSNHLQLQELYITGEEVLKDECRFVVTLGEPKFNTNLSIYKKPWGRPHNDGPALRAMAMIKLSKYLLDRKGDYDAKNSRFELC
jgi:hypothetical protein